MGEERRLRGVQPRSRVCVALLLQVSVLATAYDPAAAAPHIMQAGLHEAQLADGAGAAATGVPLGKWSGAHPQHQHSSRPVRIASDVIAATDDASPPSSPPPQVIALLGDSMTHGIEGTPNGYTDQLQKLFPLPDGTNFTVKNFGVNGGAVNENAKQEFPDPIKWRTAAEGIECMKSHCDNATIAILGFGTADSKKDFWSKDMFYRDYKKLIQDIMMMPQKPHVFLLIEPPLYNKGCFGLEQGPVNTDIPIIIQRLAKDLGLERPINTYKLFTGHPGCDIPAHFTGDKHDCPWIGDDGHPNEEAHGEIAKWVFLRIKQYLRHAQQSSGLESATRSAMLR